MDHLRWSTRTQKNLYKFTIAESKEDSKDARKFCGLRKAIDTKHKLSWITEGGQHDAKAERTRVRINAKVEFLLKGTQHKKKWLHRKWLRIWLQIDTKFELNGHGKNEALAKNFNARKRTDLSRSTTCSLNQLNTTIHKMLCSVTTIDCSIYCRALSPFERPELEWKLNRR